MRLKQIKTLPEFAEAVRLRLEVFYKEQKVDPLIEMDQFDKSAYHFIALQKKKVIGTGRVRIYNKKAKIERIAIDKRFRHKGIGTKLTRFMINFVRKKHISNIVLHAQCYAKEFYEKLGFKAVGKTFNEAKIKHIKMVYKK